MARLRCQPRRTCAQVTRNRKIETETGPTGIQELRQEGLQILGETGEQAGGSVTLRLLQASAKRVAETSATKEIVLPILPVS